MDRSGKSTAVCAVFALLLAGGFLLCVFWPKETWSDSERRRLAGRPELSADTVQSGRFMSDFETYATDTFPFRDSFRTVKALTADRIFGRRDYNGIYEKDGFLAAVEYPMDENSLNYAAKRLEYVCKKYRTKGAGVYLSVIPDKGCFLAKESGHLSMDYAEFEKKMADLCTFAEYIPVSGLLEREDYYKTDTHWRQERIVDVANRLAQAMGAETETDYETHRLERDFYGVYYGQAALPSGPDTLYYLTGDAIGRCTVYDGQNQKEIGMYDLERGMGKDPYELFLSGPLSLVTIQNPDAPEEKKLVIFRDSFASCLAPLLASGYSRITLVDIRYMHPDVLGQFVDFQSSDLLFLYSTLVLNHSDTLK